MVVNVVALTSFAVIAVVGALSVTVVRVTVVAVIGNRANSRRRDMASSNFPSSSRSGRKLSSRRSCESCRTYDVLYPLCNFVANGNLQVTKNISRLFTALYEFIYV